MTARPMSVPGLDAVLAPDGWPYACAPPTDASDPGRYHALFGRDSLITALQVLPERPEIAASDAARARLARQGVTEDPETGGAARADPARGPSRWHPTGSIEREGLAGQRDGAMRYFGSSGLDLVVPSWCSTPPVTRRCRRSWHRPGATPPPSGFEQRHGSEAAGWCGADRDGFLWGLGQQGWRDAPRPGDRRATGGGHQAREGRQHSPGATGRRRLPGRGGGRRFDALVRLDPERSEPLWPRAGDAKKSPGARLESSVRARGDGARGPTTARVTRRRLPARLAALGGRALPDTRRRGARRAGPTRVRRAHAGRRPRTLASSHPAPS